MNSVDMARRSQAGMRLVQITAHSPLEDEDGGVELIYSFENPHMAGALEHVRIRCLPGGELPSIGEYFPSAYLYENEIQELFGIRILNMTVDFKGTLYGTAERVPFSRKAVLARLAKNSPPKGEKV